MMHFGMERSCEIRKAVIEAYKQGLSFKDVKKIFHIGNPVLDSWRRRLKETGNL